MGNRAIYHIYENGKNYVFIAHNGADALSPLLRLAQAKAIQSQFNQAIPISDIFNYLGVDGQYHNPRLPEYDMFFIMVESEQYRVLQDNYNQHNGYEMYITLDLEHDNCILSYNPNCLWYHTMRSLSISLTDGLQNVEKLLAYSEKQGITDFYELLAIYNHSTGLDEMMENARSYMRLAEYLEFPQAEESRQYCQKLIEQQIEVESENMEEL